MKVSRRTFLRTAGWAGLGLTAGGLVDAMVIEPHRLQLSRHKLSIPGLPRAWDGLRIVQLTDLHCSRFVSPQFIAHAIELANACAPDLVLFTGDYITYNNHFGPPGWRVIGSRDVVAKFMRQCAAAMRKIRARYGVWASLGNHDVWFDPVVVTREIEAVGIPVVRNANQSVRINGETLPIVGLGDLWTDGVYPHIAFAEVDAPFAIVLMHNPDTFAHWSRPGAHLILAGHTHGGQVNLPLIGPPIVPSQYGAKYAQGLFKRGATQMYVNRGVGMIFPPVRFDCPPEVAVFELQSA